ncbi:MAG: queuosine 5'-phosphate N-glycosylase/hydrolase [Desulfobacterales bacterium]
MKVTLLDSIREACRKVAGQSTHVRIDVDRIAEYAQELPLEGAVSPSIDPASHYLGRGEETAAFFITLDCINFGSGYFPSLTKRPGKSGYFTIAGSLTDYFKSNGPMSADLLAVLTAEDCAQIFGQNPRYPIVAELMQLFALALNDLGRFLLEGFDGSFTDLVESVDGSAENLVRLLSGMPCYNDVHDYHGIEVPFYKRAQLTAADLSLAFEGTGLGRFEDLGRLTIFADNLVPHVLREDRVLVYSDSLQKRIAEEALVPAGSDEEIEIRACALHAVELIREAANAAGQPVTAQGLDYLLWNRGQEPLYKSVPRHRTRTVYY